MKVTATLSMVAIQREESFEIALSRADALLYLGKKQGRNRLMVGV